MLRVSGKMVMFKAKSLYDENDPTGQDDFVASRGWLDKFMKRSDLSFRRRTTTQEKDPALLIDKLVSYILHIRRLMKCHSFVPSNIYAMDETPVWMDMIVPTTIAKVEEKDIPLKSSWPRKVASYRCLTMKADGTKLKPFVVVQGAKREVKALDEEFNRSCRVATSANAWMNEELTLRYVDEILGRFAFGQRLLVWDSYEGHIMDSVTGKLRESRFERAIVPGKCTKYIQAGDVYLNKPFEERMMEKYDKWLANGAHAYNEGGNMKPVPRRLIVMWIIDAWKEVKQEMVIDSFKRCAVTTK